MPVLADTSGLLALSDRADPAHQAVRDYVSAAGQVLVVPVTVLVEADYLVGDRLGMRVELALLRAIAAGDLQLEGLTGADLNRAIDMIDQHADSNIGLADASIVAMAERLGITRILTLDHRHFRMFRPRHCPAFQLVP